MSWSSSFTDQDMVASFEKLNNLLNLACGEAKVKISSVSR